MARRWTKRAATSNAASKSSNYPAAFRTCSRAKSSRKSRIKSMGSHRASRSAIAQHVYTLGCQHGKRVQAGGGAKNVLVVMADADPDPTLRAIMGSSYGCAGQRCMAGSLLLAVGEAGDGVQRRVVEAIDKLKVANTYDDPAAQMGPVIDE